MGSFHFFNIFIITFLLASTVKAQRHINQAIYVQSDNYELFLDLDLGINGKHEVKLNYYLQGKDYYLEGLYAKCSQPEPYTCFIEDKKQEHYFIVMFFVEQGFIKLVHYTQNPLDLPSEELNHDLSEAPIHKIQLKDYIGRDR